MHGTLASSNYGGAWTAGKIYILKGALMKKYQSAALSVMTSALAVAFSLSLAACSSSEQDAKPAPQKVSAQKAEPPTSIYREPPPGAPPVEPLPEQQPPSSPVVPPPGAEAQSPPAGQDDFIVSVNGEKLTTAEVDAMLQSQMDSISKQVPPEQKEQVKAQLAQMKDKWRDQLSDYFIQKTVLAQEADRLKITVTDDEVNAQIKEYEKQIPPDTTLEDMLKQQGVTMEKLRKDIRNILKAKKLMDSQIKTGTAPTDEDIKKYFDLNKAKFDEPEKTHARHILIKTASTDDDAAKKEKRAKIEAIRKKITAGGDFAEIAKANSECPSKEKGGDLGSFARGQMVKPFEDAAFSQKIKEIGPVIETQFGYHIIQVLERTSAKSKKLEDVKPQITKTLKEQNKQKAIKDYIDGLIKKATIVYGKK